uniref:Aa_trans domain-containing protein n=1 Tax=Angiostrongylus cantonensis TaxID=6313 RepID=A0A0K0D5E3_ANGCA
MLKVCNIALVILGLAAIGLAGSQFSSVRLDNYRNIDLRLLNCIHALSGVIGIILVVECRSRVVEEQSTSRSQTIPTMGELQNELELPTSIYGSYSVRIAISALMIGDGFLATLIALVSIFLLDKLVTSALPMYPMQLEERDPIMHDWSKILVSIAVMKLFLGTGVLGLAAFVEYEHEKVN